MKKHLLFILFVCYAFIEAKAQITITQSDLPVVGSRWVSLGDNSPGGLMVLTPPGPSQTWNYSSAFTVTDTSYTLFTNPSSAPYYSDFPGSTLGVDFSDGTTTGGEFFTSNVNGLYVDGVYETTTSFLASIIIHYTNVVLFPTPCTYGFNSTNVGRTKFVIEYDTSFHQPLTKTISTETRNISCDAWGTLTTPSISNASVIRLCEKTLGSIDSTFNDSSGTGNNYVFISTTTNPPSSSVSYYFLRNAPDLAVMEIDYDTSSQSVTRAYYYDNTIPLGIKNNTNPGSACTVYPNPASSSTVNFRINDEATSSLLIYNETGKLIREQNLEGVNIFTLSTSSLPKGIYMYKTINKKGKSLSSGKFILTN